MKAKRYPEALSRSATPMRRLSSTVLLLTVSVLGLPAPADGQRRPPPNQGSSTGWAPIQIGARGEAFGSGFEVLGRLQLEHRTGTWNEWYIEWKDGRTGWLGEAQGQYFVTLPDGEVHPDEKLPEFNSIGVGQRIFVGRKRYQVAEVRMAKATGGEGELPFIVGAGYELPYADLRRPDNGFATIDYSESPPLVFTGRCVGWKQPNLTNHREFDGWRV